MTAHSDGKSVGWNGYGIFEAPSPKVPPAGTIWTFSRTAFFGKARLKKNALQFHKERSTCLLSLSAALGMDTAWATPAKSNNKAGSLANIENRSIGLGQIYEFMKQGLSTAGLTGEGRTI